MVPLTAAQIADIVGLVRERIGDLHFTNLMASFAALPDPETGKVEDHQGTPTAAQRSHPTSAQNC